MASTLDHPPWPCGKTSTASHRHSTDSILHFGEEFGVIEYGGLPVKHYYISTFVEGSGEI
jgi:hypothetical protein